MYTTKKMMAAFPMGELLNLLINIGTLELTLHITDEFVESGAKDSTLAADALIELGHQYRQRVGALGVATILGYNALDERFDAKRMEDDYCHTLSRLGDLRSQLASYMKGNEGVGLPVIIYFIQEVWPELPGYRGYNWGKCHSVWGENPSWRGNPSGITIYHPAAPAGVVETDWDYSDWLE